VCASKCVYTSVGDSLTGLPSALYYTRFLHVWLSGKSTSL
jgi:hypothetical protein